MVSLILTGLLTATAMAASYLKENGSIKPMGKTYRNLKPKFFFVTTST